MNNIKVVIGVGFGDEGKGATVNSLSDSDTLVVRFNGGSQAGHTVIHNGVRHVFSHIGSGTLKGAKTYLSRFFVCNPFAYLHEYQALVNLGIIPHVLVSPYCQITTPWDIYINRAVEDQRAKNRHGSVGSGFGETIERNEHDYSIIVDDIDHKKLIDRLRDIQKIWVPLRCSQLGIDKPEHLMSETILQRVVDDFISFRNLISVVDTSPVVGYNQTIIYEGSQGLLLDPEFGFMPHCTRSSCGLQNVYSMLGGNRPIDVHYVSRCYMTRHGNGPLPHEVQGKLYDGIVDETNIPHHYQGSLRFSPLNIDLIRQTIIAHSKYEKNFKSIRRIPTLTCLDQIDHKVSVIINNKVMEIPKELIESVYANAIGGL